MLSRTSREQGNRVKTGFIWFFSVFQVVGHMCIHILMQNSDADRLVMIRTLIEQRNSFKSMDLCQKIHKIIDLKLFPCSVRALDATNRFSSKFRTGLYIQICEKNSFDQIVTCDRDRVEGFE